MLDASSISIVLDVLGPERAALVELLRGLSPDEWGRPTECPAYSVHGVALHVLGDDLSLLSRQRDAAPNGLLLLAGELAGADFRTLLDTFNDRWVAAARFLSPALVVTLLELTGQWTADYYTAVDPSAPGELVGFFRAPGPSPFWHAIAREYVERWVHHSQIRRALELGSLADERFVAAGVEVVAAAGAVEAGAGEPWRVGAVVLGSTAQTADILTRAFHADEVRRVVDGPDDAVAMLARAAGRP